jgi:DNA-binding MarR family transcriptional regulator
MKPTSEVPTPPTPDASAWQNVDRVIHEPARLAVAAVLAACESADFVFLRRATGLTQGNLSAHLARLSEAGYITMEKRFVGNLPNTLCRLTPSGRAAFEAYRRQLQRLTG